MKEPDNFLNGGYLQTLWTILSGPVSLCDANAYYHDEPGSPAASTIQLKREGIK